MNTMIFPIKLEGNSLGKRHKQLNTLTNGVIASKLPLEHIKDIAENCDVERLLKIDLAGAQRNVEYILYNLRSDDMLYVSRALRSTWLIKDPQYAQVISPQYLHDRLFPLMINRAICKFKLTIRLHLKDESRCEEFFQYYFDNEDKRQALMFLPLCSEQFILLNLEKNKLEIPIHFVKRLCEKIPEAAYILTKNMDVYDLLSCIEKLSFLSKTHIEIYFDLIEKYWDEYNYGSLKLGRQTTFVIMQHHQDRVFSKLQKYMSCLHLPTMAKVLGPVKVKELIVMLSKNPEMDDWFSYNKIRPLLGGLSYKEKYEFLRNVFEKRVKNKGAVKYEIQSFMACSEIVGPSISNVYEWYRYAPFPTAFCELKKLIHTEPERNERLAMLKVLIESAHKNMNFLAQLLQYFHDRHINEPKNLRENFLRNLLKHTQAFRYNETCWNILNELFHNLEIYEDSSLYIEGCLDTIMLYHILRDSPVPHTILEKWWNTFSTLLPVADKLTLEEKDKVFRNIFQYTMKKINGQSLNSDNDVRNMIVLINKPLELLEEWDQPLSQYPNLLELLKTIIYKAQEFNLSDSPNYYGRNRKLNRLLFSEALLMEQTHNVFLNTLKHDTDLLKKYEVQLQQALEANNKNLDRFLSKLRIYFCNDLAAEWTVKLKGKLDETGGKGVARTICILVHRDSFSELVKTYVPQNHKIKWSEESAVQFNLRKYLAQQMHLVRPLVNVADILAFAKGDYLQYALPSLNSICFQLPGAKCEELLPKLLEGTVSLQKHAIRLAFAKVPSSEHPAFLFRLWEQANNASIRAVIFKGTFEMLCREKEEESQRAWKLLKLFMNKLKLAEDRSVYATLGRAKKVSEKIRPEFCTTSYRYLKTVPEKMNCSEHINNIFLAMPEIIDLLPHDLVYEILNAFFEVPNTEQNNYEESIWSIFQNFLLACKSETDQLERYNKIGKTYIKHTKDLWFTREGRDYPVRQKFEYFIKEITELISNVILVRNPKYITPIPLFKAILRDVEDFLPFNKYVGIHVNLQLIITILESFDSMTAEMPNVIPDERKDFDTFINRELFKHFGLKCSLLLEDYLKKLYPSFVTIFSDIINDFCDYLKYSDDDDLRKISMADALLMDSNNTTNNLLAVAILPHHEVTDHLRTDYVRVYKRLQAIDDVEIKLHSSINFSISYKYDE